MDERSEFDGEFPHVEDSSVSQLAVTGPPSPQPERGVATAVVQSIVPASI